jgi:uncharacterized protein (TIRG00374 family)
VRNVKYVLKLLVAVALIVLLLVRLDLRRLIDAWATLSWAYIALAVVITPVMVAVSVSRWSTLLAAQNMPSRTRRLAVLYLAGVLLNQFLPTSIGGDVLKAYQVGKDHNSVSRSAAAIFVDRFCGLTALVAFACVVFVLKLRHLHEPLLNVGFAVVLAGFTLLVTGVLLPRPVRWVRRVVFRGRGSGLFGALGRWHQDVIAFRRRPGAVLRCLVLATSFHLLAVVHVFWVLRIFTDAGSLGGVFVMLPGIFLVSVLPISLGGMGLHEWAYLFFLGLMHIEPELGVSVALFIRLKTILFGAGGFVAFLATRGRETPADIAMAMGVLAVNRCGPGGDDALPGSDKRTPDA